MLTDFPEHNLENMGGISTFSFVQQYGVSSFPYINRNKINTLPVIKVWYAWIKGVALLKSVKFDEVPKETDSGKLIDYTVSGFYPGHAPDISELFDEMMDQPFLLDTIDNNNQRRLLGNLNNPVLFKYNYSSPPGGRPGYSFSFVWTSPNPAPFYVP